MITAEQPIIISIVTPVYRGAHYLRALSAELVQLKETLDHPHSPLRLGEVIFVDDDSRDGSITVLRELTEEHPWMRTLQLARNFGQHPATVAGILHTSGDWVCTMDEDLQHRPMDVLSLLHKVTQEQQDICYATPTMGSHSAFRNVSSKVTKIVMAMLSGNKAIGKFNSFRMIRGSIARAAASVVAHQTYFDVALSWYTNRICVTQIAMSDMRAKTAVKSGYRLKALVRHAGRLFQSLELKTLRYAAVAGVLLMLAALAVAAFAVGSRLLYPETIALPGWALVLVSIVFFGGATALLAGLILDQIYFISQKMRGRPVFFVVNRETDTTIANWLASHISSRS